MKKRIFALIMALAILASLIVVPVSAETETQTVTASSDTCPCGCGQTLDAVTWKKWNVNEEGAPNAGHYYLDGNYTQAAQQEIMAGDRVVLDLRGFTVTSEDYSRLLLVYGRFHLIDTVGGGRFMSKTSGAAYGGVVMVSTNEVNDSLFELCSGTITRDADNKGSRRGGLIHVSATATFRMTGGMLLNGSTVTAQGTYTEPGGCVAGISSECTIEILGGKIIGGESATHGGNVYNVGTTVLKNCHIVGGVAAKSGGNVYQSGGSLTIEGCVIESGISNQTVDYGGGNIGALSGAAVSIKDSTIRNGWTALNGGNILLGNSTVTIENTTIEAGVAKNRGSNLYGTTDAKSLTIRNCEFPGDIGFVGAELKLEGKVKVGLLNTGLRLRYGSDQAAPLDASGLTEGSEIFVNTKDTFTTADVNPAYFKGANRIVLSESAEGLEAAVAASGELGGYCPHCGERVVWTAFGTSSSLVQECYLDAEGDTDPACTGKHLESGHYFLGEKRSNMAQRYIGIYREGENTCKDVVIDLAGYDYLSSGGRSFYLHPGHDAEKRSTLTILDSYGGSEVTGGGANNQPGGVIYNEGSNLVIYGGTYTYQNKDKNVNGGGVILNGRSFTMYGGTLDGSAYTYTDASTDTKTYTYRGSCLYQYNGANYSFTMTAGRMIGGTAQTGGVAYFGYNNKVNITGGQFDSGTTLTGGGGNIRMDASDDSKRSAVLNMTGVAIRDGSVEATGTGGGNLHVSCGTVDITDSYIEGGSAADYGGNICTGVRATITFTNCIVDGGYSGSRGGNAHLSSTNTYITWDNCLVMNGSATYGGNINAGNGYLTFKGGQYLFGKARTSYGGNIAALSGNVSATSTNYTRFVADDAGNVPLIAQGYAKTYGGNIYGNGNFELLEARLSNGKADTRSQDLHMTKGSNQSKMTIGQGVVGRMYVGFNAELLGEGVYGMPIDRSACEVLNATMILEGNYNDALLCAKDGVLYVGTIAVVDGSGNVSWYTDGASAVAACPADGYVKLYNAADLVLTKDITVDICGNEINISGAYTATVMDSVGGGKVTLAEETGTPVSHITPDGVRYIYVKEGNVLTAHVMEMRISSVSLRPAQTGLYYNAYWRSDEVTGPMIARYGVAVSAYNAPTSDFEEPEMKCMWTENTGSFEDTKEQASVLVAGIMKTLAEDSDRTAAQNKANGERKVHAAAYVELTDGTVLMSNAVSYSLYDILSQLDQLIEEDPINYRKYTNPLRELHTKWADFGMGEWVFNKIVAPEEDNMINILMVGNSFCYYYVEELAGLAAADGIEMRVCNLYYSGCKMSQHFNWWKNGEAPYQYYETTAADGRKGVSNVSLEWCLGQREWDYICIQSLNITTSEPEQLVLDNKLYLDTFYGYFREQFPNANMLWHQTWSYAVGTAGNGTVTTPEKQVANHERNKAAAALICEQYDLLNVPSGDAWKIIRDTGYDKLCARIGKGTDHEGDYYHDGDVGGGQYLNACVWYETITGNSVIGNTYRPVYKYNGKEIPLNSEMTYEKLQEAAHQAVADYRAAEARQ